MIGAGMPARAAWARPGASARFDSTRRIVGRKVGRGAGRRSAPRRLEPRPEMRTRDLQPGHDAAIPHEERAGRACWPRHDAARWRGRARRAAANACATRCRRRGCGDRDHADAAIEGPRQLQRRNVARSRRARRTPAARTSSPRRFRRRAPPAARAGCSRASPPPVMWASALTPPVAIAARQLAT